MEVSSSSPTNNQSRTWWWSTILTRHTLLYLPPAFLLSRILTTANLDTYCVSALCILLLSRVLSIFTLRAKTSSSWHGESEPGVQGDLLILLSEDRWIRMRGLVDDLKAVTSGSWLSATPPRYYCRSLVYDFLDWTSRLLVYVASIVLANAPDADKILVVTYAVLSHAALALYNTAPAAQSLNMNGRQVNVPFHPNSVQRYSRRLAMARELIKEMGRSDFALKLGMINVDEVDSTGRLKDEIVTM